MHIDCVLDRAGLHAIAFKRMNKDRYVLHNRLRDLWKRKGVKAGDIGTTEPCTDDILTNQFGPAILRHAFPKAPSQGVKQTTPKIHEFIKQPTTR